MLSLLTAIPPANLLVSKSVPFETDFFIFEIRILLVFGEMSVFDAEKKTEIFCDNLTRFLWLYDGIEL